MCKHIADSLCFTAEINNCKVIIPQLKKYMVPRSIHIDPCKPSSLIFHCKQYSSPYQFSQFSRSVMSDSLHESQHARPPCPSQTPRVYSN